MKGLWHEPLGVDFSAAVIDGLRARLGDAPPEALARVTILVSTNRMAARLRAACAAQGPTLLPRIGLVSDLRPLLPPGTLPEAGTTGLALRLRLTRLVRGLLQARPDLSPPEAAFDLAGTLLTLLDEMQEEAMDPEALERIETGALSEHWQRSLEFLRLVTHWAETTGEVTPAAIQTEALHRLTRSWQAAPPTDPVIIAGSTASRAPTRRLIRAVLDLPQGAVILPGLDTDMPDLAWAELTQGEGPGAQDHPQYRHAALLADHDRSRADCPQWSGARPVAPARNRLISLALRPAPATDAWREEGPALSGIDAACAGITLLAAPSPGAEAQAIALGLRAALADGRRAALITPDRGLSRQVAAQLDRWGIEPDDSAGRPLVQSAPGRLLMQSAAMLGQTVEAEPLAILLAHPLVQAGAGRGDHLKQARTLEVALLRETPCPFPTPALLRAWADDPGSGAMSGPWIDWLAALLDNLATAPGKATLAKHLTTHLTVLDHLTGPSDPWTAEAGRSARAVVETLSQAAPELDGQPITTTEYARILHALLSAEEVRESFAPHPDAMIWGALEARVRTAPLVILGGLNDGIWPGQPSVDPWLNRAMRAEAGLRLPDRSVGLSAHDFQQAASGPEIWLSRAARDAEAETVPSRWLNRIENLLGGLGTEAKAVLDAMRARGDHWLTLAAALDRPAARVPAATRPAPIVPAEAQPKRLSVTAIETLIRDPYATYARYVLGLRALGPLRQGPDARLRGVVVHTAMERFARALPDELPDDAAARLRDTLEQTLQDTAPWPAMRRIWLGKFDRLMNELLTAEARRRAAGRPLFVEEEGHMPLPGLDFTLTAKADRLDDRGGSVAIYDYKTGKPPSGPQQAFFAKQLLLEAVMVEDGAFPAIAQRHVDEIAYLQVGSKYDEVRVKLDADVLADTRAGLRALIQAYRDGRPWVARLAPDFIEFSSDYDQLSRRGEWDDTDRALPQRVGR